MTENKQFTPEELKTALKAFKRRLRILRRDDESGLSRGAMTGGKRSSIAAVKPPYQFPKEIWEELVRMGKLKCVSNGLYELVQH